MGRLSGCKPKVLSILAILLIVALWLLAALPIYAQVPEPDGTFNISQVEVYRHVLEENDQLYLITGTVEYDTTPDQPISDTFLVRLMNGAAELGSTTFYAYHDNGYDYGTCSIYFSAAEVASIPVAWGGGFDIKLQGNPTIHWLDSTATTAMGGALQDDGGAFTDYTAESNSVAINDVLLMPHPAAVEDAFYFGSSGMFDILTINIGTQGAWTGSYTWEYWDGDEWKSVSGLNDNSLGFTTGTGNYDITYDCPTDWQLVTVDAIELYWLRFRVATWTASVTQPKGTQCWTNTLADPPSIETNSITWHDEGSVSAARTLLTTRIRGLAAVTETSWGIAEDLITTILGVGKLTLKGEDYYENSITNLRVMCPGLFMDVLTTPDFVEHPLVDDYYMGADDTSYDIYGNNWQAQTFTPSTSYSINGVELKLSRTGAPGDLTVSIRDTAANVPIIAVDLTSSTFDDDDITTDEDGIWYVISFDADHALTAGTEYAIVLTTGGGVADYITWIADSAGTYAGGQGCVSLDNDLTWNAIAGTVDFDFAIHATGAYSMSYRNRLASRLVGTRFDMTTLGANFGLSRMWMSSVVWILLACLLPAIFAVRAANSYKPATLIFALMLPMGALSGFIYLEIAAVAAFFFAAAAIYVFFYKGSP